LFGLWFRAGRERRWEPEFDASMTYASKNVSTRFCPGAKPGDIPGGTTKTDLVVIRSIAEITSTYIQLHLDK
jgi:hypothetical protein